MDQANTMRAAGATFETIAVALRRPVSAVHGHMRWHDMTPEQRERRATKMRERKRRNNMKLHPYLRGRARELNTVKPIIPCPIALAERALRMALGPRDLTAAFMGDPLPGFSALDRR